MPRLTSRVFTDLAIWMAGFGLLIGLIFPPFCLLLGLPPERVISPLFFGSTLTAGAIVGALNFALARLVVGRRLRILAEAMTSVEARMKVAVFTHDFSGCDPEACALPVDSADEVGASASAFNRLIGTLARSHAVENAMRDFSAVLSSKFELEALGAAALDGLLRHSGAQAGAIFVARDDELVAIASYGLRRVDELPSNDHVRRAMRLGRTERLTVAMPELVVDSLLLAQPARDIVIAPVTFKSVPLGTIVLAATGAFHPDAEQLVEQFVGDRALKAIAGACRRVLREGDVLVRYGGEEFLVLLPGAGTLDIIQIGERIRRAIGETVVMDANQRVTVAVSLGGTTYRDIGVESADALVAEADAALYRAKATGRDRLVMWGAAAA